MTVQFNPDATRAALQAFDVNHAGDATFDKEPANRGALSEWMWVNNDLDKGPDSEPFKNAMDAIKNLVSDGTSREEINQFVHSGRFTSRVGPWGGAGAEPAALDDLAERLIKIYVEPKK